MNASLIFVRSTDRSITFHYNFRWLRVPFHWVVISHRWHPHRFVSLICNKFSSDWEHHLPLFNIENRNETPNNGKNSIDMQSSQCDSHSRSRWWRKRNESDEKRFVLSFVDATDAIVALLIYVGMCVCVCSWLRCDLSIACALHSAIKQNQTHRIAAVLCYVVRCVVVCLSRFPSSLLIALVLQFNLHNAFEPSKICIWFYSKRWYDVNTAQYIHKFSKNTMQTKVKQTTSNENQ